MSFVFVILGFLLCGLFFGCSPRFTMHTENIEADSIAITRQVDASLTRWTHETDSAMHQTLNLYLGWQLSTEREHETIIESVVTTVDSLGQEIRTEHRTISRETYNDRAESEQKIASELGVRLTNAIARQDSIWHYRLDSVTAIIARHDSTYIAQKDEGESRPPWYRRWLNIIKHLLAGAAIGLLGWLYIRNKL